MRQLVNQFTLRPGVARAAFEADWAQFIAHLVDTDLAKGSGPLMTRHPASGFDTDATRAYDLFALIDFRDQAQADAAWAAIEDGREPLRGLHRRVFAKVHDPVFTFWGTSGE